MPNSEETETNEMPSTKLDGTKNPVPGSMEEQPINMPEVENTSPESDDSKE